MVVRWCTVLSIIIVLDQISLTVDFEMKIQTHVDFWSGATPILNNDPLGDIDKLFGKFMFMNR